MSLPERLGDLTVVRTRGHGDASRTLCICSRGHKQWRNTQSLQGTLRRGQKPRCETCGPLIGNHHLNLLAAIAAFGEVYGCGPTQLELNRFFGHNCQNIVETLARRGLISRCARNERHLTEAGWVELEWSTEALEELVAQ